MKDLFFAFGLLLFGFVALQMRATRKPYDYRVALRVDKDKEESLSAALEKALEEKKARTPTSVPR